MVFVIVDDENRNRHVGNAVGLGSFGRGHVGDDTKLLALEGGGIGGAKEKVIPGGGMTVNVQNQELKEKVSSGRFFGR